MASNVTTTKAIFIVNCAQPLHLDAAPTNRLLQEETKTEMEPCPPLPHIVIFPFLSKGHTIPLLHLAHIIHTHRLATLTFFTTPRNFPFLSQSLTDTTADIVQLPFPANVPDLPPDVESTEQLPSMSLFLPFISATKLLQSHFEHSLSSLPTKPTFLISDGFLSWTVDSASKFNVPTIISNGMGNFAMTIHALVTSHIPPSDLKFKIPAFEHLEFTKADFNPPFDDPTPSGPLYDFVTEQRKARKRSSGLIVNSFSKLEQKYINYWNKNNIGPKAWCVGPLCLAKRKGTVKKTELIEWLDARTWVAYIAFGSQVRMSPEQMQEIAVGLERSGVEFLWALRGDVKVEVKRGRIERGWVDQLEILRHESVKVFVSHCGWNSVLESICAGVPIIAWPMMAEQHVNAKLVVDELGIGVRVWADDGTKFGLVKAGTVEEAVEEMVNGEVGKTAKEKVEKLAVEAEMAMDEGGSSMMELEDLIDWMSASRVGVK